MDPKKLHVRIDRGIKQRETIFPRRYTLTHSDLTGDLFLSVGTDYNHKAISGLYTRLMRDEVLAEWIDSNVGPALHVYCHVSGGWVFGAPGWRDEILRYHLPQVLQSFRYGDRGLFEKCPELEESSVLVHFRASQPKYHRMENWGKLKGYNLQE